ALMVMSYPHFLYADSVYRNGVIGLVPNEESHRLFVDLEP
ncbi:jg26330, partial [Pararge aegeria aegeria]